MGGASILPEVQKEAVCYEGGGDEKTSGTRGEVAVVPSVDGAVRIELPVHTLYMSLTAFNTRPVHNELVENIMTSS